MVNKKIYVTIHVDPKKTNHEKEQVLDEILDVISTVKHIEKIEAQLGLNGARKTRHPSSLTKF